MTTGCSRVTSSRSQRVGRRPSANRVQSIPKPRTQPPGGVRSAARSTRTRSSAIEPAEAGRASTAKNVSAVQAKWLWASMKPGTTVRPATSIASASGPAAVTTSASSPAATIRPARIATAPAVGRRGSQVTTWPFRRTSPRSEPSTVHLANESKGDTSVPCGEAQRAAPKEEDTVTGRSKRLFGLVATAGLILSACTSGGGANSQVPTGSGTTASVAPTGAPPSAAAVAITAPTSLLKAGELSNCVDIEYSPMEFFAPSDPNTPVGFDV